MIRHPVFLFSISLLYFCRESRLMWLRGEPSTTGFRRCKQFIATQINLSSFFLPLSLDDLVKSHQTMVSIVGARCFAPDIGHAQRAPTLQGAQKLRSEAYLQVRCNAADGLFTKPSSFAFHDAKRKFGQLASVNG